VWRSGGEQRLGERDDTAYPKTVVVRCVHEPIHENNHEEPLPGYPKGLTLVVKFTSRFKWYVPRRQEEYDTVYRAFRKWHKGTHTNKRGCLSGSRQLPLKKKFATGVVCACVDCCCMLVLEGTSL